jgi:hypothetical protein
MRDRSPLAPMRGTPAAMPIKQWKVDLATPEGPAGIKSGLLPAMMSGRMTECGEAKMTHSDLVKVEIHGPDIFVAMRGACFRVKYRKEERPWLVAREYGLDDPGA